MAELLIDNGPSQSANNQLLKILQVSIILFLSIFTNNISIFQSKEDIGLSYHNMDNLKRKISSLPKQGEWQTCTMALSEDPGVQHQIYYRNPIDVIKSLQSNPTYADQMAFAPQKVWTSSDKTSQLYNEMWTGDWWWKIQVLFLIKFYSNIILNNSNIIIG